MEHAANIMKLKGLGFFASFIDSITIFSKVIETYQLKSTQHISTTWLITAFFSSLLWLIYASVNKITLSLISSLCVFISILALFCLKCIFKETQEDIEKEIKKLEKSLMKLYKKRNKILTHI